MLVENQSRMYNKQQLIELIKKEALKFGDFTLASGKKAKFYLDCRKLTLTGEGANLVAHGVLDLLGTDLPDAVGGMAIGADPVTAAIVTVAWQRNTPVRGFIVRKESKSHGTGRDVEGPVHQGDSVVIVEDTVTTGGSSLKAIDKARAFGLEVREVIAIVDRKDGAEKLFAEHGIPFRSLVSIDELGIDKTVE